MKSRVLPKANISAAKSADRVANVAGIGIVTIGGATGQISDPLIYVTIGGMSRVCCLQGRPRLEDLLERFWF